MRRSRLAGLRVRAGGGEACGRLFCLPHDARATSRMHVTLETLDQAPRTFAGGAFAAVDADAPAVAWPNTDLVLPAFRGHHAASDVEPGKWASISARISRRIVVALSASPRRFVTASNKSIRSGASLVPTVRKLCAALPGAVVCVLKG